MANLILIINEENWKVLLNENIMGFGGKWGKIYYPKIQENDNCIFYIGKKIGLSGVFMVISKNPKKEVKWKTGKYELLISLKPIFIPEKPISVINHLDKLDFIKNKNHWGSYFRFPRFISDKDYNSILKLMKK